LVGCLALRFGEPIPHPRNRINCSEVVS
jgi:hypothetical protein